MWFNAFRIVAVAAICAVSSRYYLHMMQLESYQIDGYRRWLDKNRDMMGGWTLIIGVIGTAVSLVLGLVLGMMMSAASRDVTGTILMLAIFAFAAYQFTLNVYKTPPKKPIVFTARMKRLAICLSAVYLLAAAALEALNVPGYLLFAAVPYAVIAAAYIMSPIEKRINAYYSNDAKRKLDARPELIKIGITGSYGKTSTKFIMAAILGERFDVLATPSSFNTPMGLTRVIREMLEDRHNVFIAEMGARHAGDIKELVEIVHPKYGVLTSVGEQHLETFGSVEVVANTKFELIEGLPADGVAFFSADDGIVDQLFKRAKCEKYRVGVGKGHLSFYAEDISVGTFGSQFTLCESGGERVVVKTKLLGEHNIKNIIIGCAVARKLGMTMEEIARGAAKAEPVEHRLQLMPGAKGMTIIDDAFNSNPVGAKAALDVLGAFPGRRLIVTPGMVEQGAREAELNKAFGMQMNGKCDVVILVGQKRTKPIAEGLGLVAFPKENIYTVRNLDEASALLGKIGKPNDVILFENDLPDNYSE